MKFLLDTHVLVWAIARPERLSARVQEVLRAGENDLFVSAVTTYEIEFKRSVSSELGRLPFDLDQVRGVFAFDWLDVTRRHASQAGRLPRIHRDPWDRILVAQAIDEVLTLVTKDAALGRYNVPVIW